MPSLLVYNIRKEQFASGLTASGVANRWNKSEEFVIYTGSSRALSALELVVHRSAISLETAYKLLVIELTVNDADIQEILPDELPSDWQSLKNYPKLQAMGSEWYRAQKAVALKIPSAVIPQESNYLLNTKHPDFSKKVSLKAVEDFDWDGRLL